MNALWKTLLRPAALIPALSGPTYASTFEILANTDPGASPFFGGTNAALAADSSGDLFVQSAVSSSSPSGVLSELTAESGYTRVKTLYKFGQDGQVVGGYRPQGGVTLTPHNVILGTTPFGGVNGGGVVFNLNKPSAIQSIVLHAFSGSQAKPTDGQFPTASLVFGLSNRYYGTTELGGSGANAAATRGGDGIVFSVSSSPTDPRYTIVHRFGGKGDGYEPSAGTLAVDAQGRLFGTTLFGGRYNAGTVYMLQYVNGGWQEQVLHNFNASGDLQSPPSNLVIDDAGNIYGCAQGGTYLRGGIFRLTPPTAPASVWKEQIIHMFGQHPHDALAADSPYPVSGAFEPGFDGCGLTRNPSTGVIVGTSFAGGEYSSATAGGGTIFVLTPPTATQSQWKETIGHSFRQANNPPEGKNPVGALLLIGDTYYGGDRNNGAIYAFKP